MYWVDYIYKVFVVSVEIVGEVVNMEIGMCGFLVVGVDEFLELYESGEKVFFVEIQELQQIVSDNFLQVECFKEVEQLIVEWMEKVMEFVINLCCLVLVGN